MAFLVTFAFLDFGTALMATVITALAAGLLGAGISLAWPVLRVLWHWAGEIILAGLLLGLYAAVAAWLTPVWGLVALAVVVGLPWVFGPVRRFLVRWGWCMVTRHRLRVACDSFIEGKGVRSAVMPLILTARPTESGERVGMWLRGDLTVAEVEDRLAAVASTCWANSAEVWKKGQKASHVVVDIHRRDILAEDVPMPVGDMLDGIEPHSYEDLMPDVDEDVTDDPEIRAAVEQMLNPRGRKPRQPKNTKADKAATAAVSRPDDEGPDEGDEDYIPEFV
ncbi:hypothetical protein [Glycomyces tenuis]|uniref:hypothetical protein n=1 Tax=Glycomyces tenuis TaxID=58116 RepID=UPI00047CDB37|nr:hypothetical protein [Glycomyces tenuis]